MGQYWILINIDRRECLPLRGAKLGEFFFYDHNNLLTLVTQPTLPPQYLSIPYRDPQAVDIPEQGIAKLPTEILSKIFSEIKDIHDVFCFARTCTFLFDCGVKCLDKICERYIKKYSWIGNRVLCIGDYARNNDLPDGMLGEGELETLAEGCGEGEDEGEDGYNNDIYNYNLGCSYAKNEGYGSQCLKAHPILKKISPNEQKELNKLVVPQYITPSSWVLCNIKRREYISSEALTELTPSPPDILYTPTEIGLGQALLSQICWSSDPSCSMSYEGDIHRGRWAGEGFVVVPSDQLEHIFEGDEKITDISSEVVNMLKEIWRSDFGEGWKKEAGLI